MPTWNQDCSRSERGMLSKIAVLDWCKIFRQLQGMELYPRLGKNFDIKDFLHCRFGMMAWTILIISCAIKQASALHNSFGTVMQSEQCGTLLRMRFWGCSYWTSGFTGYSYNQFVFCSMWKTWEFGSWLHTMYSGHGTFNAMADY